VTESIEFSDFFRLLNEIKEGDLNKQELLDKKMEEYKSGENAKSFLDELGKIFLYQGMLELYKYTNSKDIKLISQLDKADWEKLKEKNEDPLPQFLSNTMLSYAKENNIAKEISNKWKVSGREINKHLRPMSRYLTEGIIELLE